MGEIDTLRRGGGRKEGGVSSEKMMGEKGEGGGGDGIERESDHTADFLVRQASHAKRPVPILLFFGGSSVAYLDGPPPPMPPAQLPLPLPLPPLAAPPAPGPTILACSGAGRIRGNFFLSLTPALISVRRGKRGGFTARHGAGFRQPEK